MGNNQSTTHEPNPPDEQPVRSALSRSRSVRSDANWISEQSSQIENKYLSSNVYSRPTNNSNTLLKHHHPTMPYNNNGVEPFSSGTGGYDSPQWGWYINTTPPSPDMYFTAGGRPTKSMKISGLSIPSDVSSGGDSTASSQLIQSSMVTGSSNAHPNPVFQCLQDKHKAAPMVAWPSVPL